jgi:hypothetical protein
MIMSIKVLRYGKKIGFILAGVLIGVCSGISSVSAGEDVGSRGFARPGFNRPAFNRPAFNRPAFQFNRPAVRPIVAERPFVRPIVNPVVLNVEEDLCVEEEAFLFISDECVVVKDEED